MQRTANGFSLIELLLTLAIVAIVMTLATNSYSSYMMRALRGDGTSLLLRVAAAQERFYLVEDRYAGPGDLEQLGFKPPAGAAAYTSEHGHYTLAIEASSLGLAVGYTASVNPADDGGQKRDKDCAELSINERGERQSLPKAADICWR